MLSFPFVPSDSCLSAFVLLASLRNLYLVQTVTSLIVQARTIFDARTISDMTTIDRKASDGSGERKEWSEDQAFETSDEGKPAVQAEMDAVDEKKLMRKVRSGCRSGSRACGGHDTSLIHPSPCRSTGALSHGCLCCTSCRSSTELLSGTPSSTA